MEQFFKAIKSAFPKSVAQYEKNYLSFSFGGALYYQLRVQKDKVRMMATNYPAKAKLGECLKIIKKHNVEGYEINGREICFEVGEKNPEIFTLRLEFPYSGAQLDNDSFINDVVDSCAKFHEAILPLVNNFMKQPAGDLYGLMGGTRNDVEADSVSKLAAESQSATTSNATLQQVLAEAFLGEYPDAEVKKIDKDNYLDIHLPSVHPKRGTHLCFITAAGRIKIAFYCRYDEFNGQVVTQSDSIEPYSQGLRIKGNPAFETVDSAIRAAIGFVSAMLEASGKVPIPGAKARPGVGKTDLVTKSIPVRQKVEVNTSDTEGHAESISGHGQVSEIDNREKSAETVDGVALALEARAAEIALEDELMSERGDSSYSRNEDQTAGLPFFLIGSAYERQFRRFREIADKTGILINQVEIPPDRDARDELWEIVRVFTQRIYQIEDAKISGGEELNTLCFYSIVALNWCGLTADEGGMSNVEGRFRRDTIALALCLFTRLDRRYAYYDFLKSDFILPHVRTSVLRWTVSAMSTASRDYFFNIFTGDQIKEANQVFLKRIEESVLEIESVCEAVADGHPVKQIREQIFTGFAGTTVPYMFILNYIGRSLQSDSPIKLLGADLDRNGAYLERQVLHRQFPDRWSLAADLAFIFIYFSYTTDAELSEKEKNTILDLINKWGETVQLRYTEEYIEDACQLAESLFGTDQSQERFGYVLENIYRSLFVWFGYDEEKTKIQLKLLLDDLLLIAEADSEVETAEVDLIVLIKTHWGVDWGS